MRFDCMGVPIGASAVPLLEPDGTSQWMTSKLAEKHAQPGGGAHSSGSRSRRLLPARVERRLAAPLVDEFLGVAVR